MRRTTQIFLKGFFISLGAGLVVPIWWIVTYKGAQNIGKQAEAVFPWFLLVLLAASLGIYAGWFRKTFAAKKSDANLETQNEPRKWIPCVGTIVIALALMLVPILWFAVLGRNNSGLPVYAIADFVLVTLGACLTYFKFGV